MRTQHGTFAEQHGCAHDITMAIASSVDVARVIAQAVVVAVTLRIDWAVASIDTVGWRQRYETLTVDDRAGWRTHKLWRDGNCTRVRYNTDEQRTASTGRMSTQHGTLSNERHCAADIRLSVAGYIDVIRIVVLSITVGITL